MDDNLQAELDRLKAENARLKRDRGRTVSLKVSEKGGVSVYGVLATCPVHPHNKGFRLRAVSLC